MKNAKRLVIAILSLVLLVSSALLVFAACDGYKITLNYDSSKGTVTLSEPENGSKYEKGETVLVIVAPKSGYKVASFSVTGYDDAKLSNGKYMFEVIGKTVITVTFEQLTGDYYTVEILPQTIEGATYTLSPEPTEGMYKDGTEVTLTLQVQQGYAVGKTTVDYSLVPLVDNKLIFTVYHDTLVEIEVYREIPDSVLQSLLGNIMFRGEVLERQVGSSEDAPPSDYYYFVAMYDADKRLVWQMENGLYNSDDVMFGCDEQGYAAYPTHGYDGKFAWQRMTDKFGNDLAFDSYFNPFEYLDKSNFILLKEGGLGDDYDSIWGLNATASKNVLKALTDYDYDVKAFEIVVVDGVVTEIVFETNTYRSGRNNVYTNGYFDVSHDLGEYAFDDEILAPQYDEQSKLQTALNDAAAATKYKVEHRYPDDTYYEIYRVEDTIWAEGGAISYGYLMRDDGQLWQFGFDKKGAMVLSRRSVGDNILDAAATFDLTYESVTISPSMFKEVSDGRYMLRDHDLNGYYGGDLVFASTQSFATGGLEMNEFNEYGSNIAIVLNQSGELYQVEIIYYVQGSEEVEEYKIILTFSEFGTAQLPTSLQIDSNVVKGTIPEEYLGIWVCDDTYVRVDVALDTVAIDGAVSTSLTYEGNDTYKFVVYGKEHTLTIVNGDTLQLDGEKTLRRHDVNYWEDMIGSYSGESDYQYPDGSRDKLELTITAEGITFNINGFQDECAPDEFLYTEEDGGATIMFAYIDPYYGECIAFIFLVERRSVVNFYVIDGYYCFYDINAYTDGYVRDDWSEHVGEYDSDGDYSLSIEQDKITIYYKDEVEAVFTSEQITYYAVEYIKPLFELTHGTTVYSLEQYGGSSGRWNLFIGDDETPVALFVKSDYEMQSADIFAGKYAGESTQEDGTTVNYRIEITAEGFTLWIGKTQYKATVTDLDCYSLPTLYGYVNLYVITFTCGDKEYVLYQYEEGYSDLWILEDEEDVLCLLELVDEFELDD